MYVESTAKYLPSTRADAPIGAVSSDSMVPLRRSSAKVRMLSAGHSKSSVIERSTEFWPK